MEDNRNKDRQSSGQQGQSHMAGNRKSGDQQDRPKGAEKMDESYSKPATDNHQRGDSSRYANTSDNENYGNEA